MPDLVITYTFRSPCACCAVVAQEDVEYSGPHDLEGRHTFTGGVECHAPASSSSATLAWPAWAVVGFATTAPSGRPYEFLTGSVTRKSPNRSPYVPTIRAATPASARTISVFVLGSYSDVGPCALPR